MTTAEENNNDKNTVEDGKGQFPAVPENAIVKPEEERPVKMQIHPEENIEERETEIESADAGSEDMDGDGSPDWDPTVGPGV